VAQPESAINATLATNKIPRFTMLIASSGSAFAGASLKAEQGHNADQTRRE